MREMEGIIQLKKYRAMERRYGKKIKAKNNDDDGNDEDEETRRLRQAIRDLVVHDEKSP